MFTQGQLIFAGIALFLFVLLMVYSYGQDKRRNRDYFKNSYVILIVFILFIGFLIFLKFYFRGQ